LRVERFTRRAPRAPYYVDASADRAKPQRIVLDPHGRGEIRARAPRAGTWWFVVVSDASRTPGAFRFVATHGGAAAQLTLTLDASTSGERVAAANAEDANKLEIELPYSPAPPPPFLLRVTTTTELKFHVFASRRSEHEATPP
jgi:hypothetical protein